LFNLKHSSLHTIINKTPFPSHSQKFSPSIHISDQQHGLDELNTKTETVNTSQLFKKVIHKIAVMYELGTYVQKDLHKALKWHLRAANLGYASAQSDVGIFYEDGLTGRPNIATAVFWYKKATAQGDLFAIEALQRLQK